MIAYDLAVWLADQGLGTYAVDVFDTALPEEVDNALLVRDYAGAAPDFEHNQLTPVLNHPRVQIVVRNTSVTDAYTDAASAYSIVQTLENMTLNGTRYLCAQALQYPFWLRQDEQNRHYVVFNVAVTVAG